MAAYPKQLEKPMFADEFVEWMKTWAWNDKYELLDGEPVAMAGGTYDNEVIAQNIAGNLFVRLQGKDCRALRDYLMRSPATNRFAVFPDVWVRCGPPPEGTTLWSDDPVAVFEVLSPSTMHIDRGYKHDEYRNIPTLQHYVIVYPREVRIEVWSRGPGASWQDSVVATTPDGVVDLPAVGVTLSVAEIYDGTAIARAVASA